MGLVISTFGDSIYAELSACLPVLVDCMGNEMTRLTALKAFSVIAASPLHVDLSCVLENVIAELTAFLRKANRALRQASLETLNSFIVPYGDKISSSAYEVIIAESSTLISDSGLHTTAFALELCCSLMADRNSTPDVCLTVRDKVLPRAFTLIRSSLLQGGALMALQNFFTSLVYFANMNFESVLDSLVACAKTSSSSRGITKQALFSIAQCIAVLCLAAGHQKCSSTVNMLTELIKGGSTNYNVKYLPFFLDQIDNQTKNQYLLLHSLKEAIVRQSVDKREFQNSSVDKILSWLFNHCESEEEGVRNVVAECLGMMALTKPAKLVPALKPRISSSAAFTRAIVVNAFKFSVAESPEKIDEILYPEISSFLMLIKDHELPVRRAAILALSAAASKNKKTKSHQGPGSGTLTSSI